MDSKPLYNDGERSPRSPGRGFASHLPSRSRSPSPIRQSYSPLTPDREEQRQIDFQNSLFIREGTRPLTDSEVKWLLLNAHTMAILVRGSSGPYMLKIHLKESLSLDLPKSIPIVPTNQKYNNSMMMNKAGKSTVNNSKLGKSTMSKSKLDNSKLSKSELSYYKAGKSTVKDLKGMQLFPCTYTTCIYTKGKKFHRVEYVTEEHDNGIKMKDLTNALVGRLGYVNTREKEISLYKTTDDKVKLLKIDIDECYPDVLCIYTVLWKRFKTVVDSLSKKYQMGKSVRRAWINEHAKMYTIKVVNDVVNSLVSKSSRLIYLVGNLGLILKGDFVPSRYIPKGVYILNDENKAITADDCDELWNVLIESIKDFKGFSNLSGDFSDSSNESSSESSTELEFTESSESSESF